MKRTLFAGLYDWAANRLYDEFAWGYDWVSWLVSFGQWDAYRSQVLDYIQGSRILEIGFGTGEILLKLTRENYSVVGVDSSIPMHRITRSKFNKLDMECKTILGRTQSLPFSPNSFDCILSTFPADFICDLDTFLEFKRILSHENKQLNEFPGRVVVCGALFNRDDGLLNRLFHFIFGEPDLQPIELFSRLAREAGFRISIIQQKDDKIQLPVMLFEVN
jgi:ubiquinone/menaquinone biosynthesis C-methylase UbiE